MSDSNDHIRSISEDFKPTPPPMAWDRIEKRLSNVKTKSKRKKYNLIRFWFSIAASLMVIITCTYIIYQESNNTQTYGVEYVAEWEDLDIQKDYFYSIENARMINNVSKVSYQN